MKSFINFVQDFLYESKHSLNPGEDPVSVLNNPKEHKIRKIHAVREVTSANGHAPEHYVPHLNRMKSGDAWEQIAVINHPDAQSVLSKEDHESLKNHSNSKVRAAYEKRFGAGASSTPVAPKAEKSSEKKPAAKVVKKSLPSFDFGSPLMRQQSHKYEFGKGEEKKSEPAAVKQKPAAKKKPVKQEQSSGVGYSVEKVDPEESQIGYDAETVHHVTHNGKVIGAVTVSSHEDGSKKKTVKSWKGHPEKGFSELGRHSDLTSAMKSVVGSHK